MKRIKFLILILITFMLIVIIKYYYISPKKYYDRIINNGVFIKDLYGWEIVPRNDKNKTSYIFYLHRKDSLLINMKSPKFYLINNKEIKFPEDITYNDFAKILQLNNIKQVKDSLANISKIFISLDANRLISDLQNENVIYINFGRKERISFLFIPENSEMNDKLLDAYNKLDDNWYYNVHFFK